MELKPGYKQTEVGLIPESWTAEALGPHVEIRSGESPSLFRLERDGVPYFKVDQLNSDTKYLSSTPYFFQGEKTVLQGSLIFPKRGASILLNKVRILERNAFMDTNLMTLTPKSTLDNEYLYYALLHIRLWRIADTTSIPQINNKHIVPLVIPIPPLPEQRAIAAALSDVDALIGALDQLIAKKRDLKQAAMQQLLTGQHRLPGFHGKCVKAPLIRFATGISVYGVSKGNVRSIEVPLPRVEEQTAIATVLSDMDAEIAALEARRDKTRALKQGMMQELLTGRIRLV